MVYMERASTCVTRMRIEHTVCAKKDESAATMATLHANEVKTLLKETGDQLINGRKSSRFLEVQILQAHL